MRRLDEEQSDELHRLHREGSAILGWLTEHDGFTHGSSIRSLLDEALGKQQLGRMRSIGQELRGLIGGLPPEIRQRILTGIGERGDSVAADLEIDADVARAIVGQGQIKSDAEYYTLRHYLDRLDADPHASEAERRAVQAILGNYGGGSTSAAT